MPSSIRNVMRYHRFSLLAFLMFRAHWTFEDFVFDVLWHPRPNTWQFVHVLCIFLLPCDIHGWDICWRSVAGINTLSATNMMPSATWSSSLIFHKLCTSGWMLFLDLGHTMRFPNFVNVRSCSVAWRIWDSLFALTGGCWAQYRDVEHNTVNNSSSISALP